MLKVARHARRFACAALIAITACGPAAANFTCEGRITYLGMNPEGFVSVSIGGFGVWYICSQTAPFVNAGYTFSPEGCRAWYATFLANQKSEQSIVFFFISPSSTSNGPECTALGNWATPTIAPYHMTVRGP
jgi:hypothetical protein